ncbi:hypothetical protein [Endozoicomonas sp. SCSIO W0465]|uniref:hypothetical protein n=1 Tax=Endozoicomonas sp. SCSIO W0465 TaxID=2918516 RepID=UPI002074FED3|nr:hypothetical protein [Endozoicomonas sp. SCSIO W0465]USE33761.1 hypothetical protein MJO57_16380 [Endozoicomonas sp. SCSIO W0465]
MNHPLSILKKLQALACSAKKDHSARYDCFESTDDLAALTKLDFALGMINQVISQLEEKLTD